MPLNLIKNTGRLQLSASDLAGMTEWPSALIEDYLNLVRAMDSVTSAIDFDFGTMALQDADDVAITGGTVTVTSVTADSGNFDTLQATSATLESATITDLTIGNLVITDLDVENLNVSGNTTLGDSASDALVINPQLIQWTNSPTHLADHTFVGAITFPGTLDVSSGTLTLADDQISGDKLDGGVYSNFESTGIDDNADANAITIDSTERVIIGYTANIEARNLNAALQIHRATSGAAFTFIRWQAVSGGPIIVVGKSRSGTIGSYSIVQDGDTAGEFVAVADDGTDLNSIVGQMGFYIDGTPGANDTPGRWSLAVTPDGASTPVEQIRVSQNGNVVIRNNTLIGGVPGTDTPVISGTRGLDINGDTLRIRNSRTPASAGATGNQGEIAWDSDYIYVATGTNAWKRVAISTW